MHLLEGERAREIVDPAPDLADAAQQLRHAREQIALAGQYPGRSLPATPRAEVISLRPAHTRKRIE
jgi:hypothetical protein